MRHLPPPSFKPEVVALVARGNVTVEEMEKLRLNSFEWEAIYPALTQEAYLKVVEHALKNVAPCVLPASTYDEALVHFHVPELVRRLKAASGTP